MLSNRPLQYLTPKRPRYRILSHPVTIEDEYYPRNAFTFNFCLVLEEATGFHSYLPVVKKLATLFRDLEETEKFLSRELSKHGPNSGRIYAICEILLEDLNNYSECMIPIDGTTSTLNIKLFPIYPSPPPLHAWQVPLLTVNLDDMIDDSWDLTMCIILPYIDGVNSVQHISVLADADLRLVRKAIRHLLYYGCVALLDIFSFSAIYAPTPSISGFVEDEAMQRECLRYVSIPSLVPTATIANDSTQNDNIDASFSQSKPQIRTTTLLELYLSLHQGQSVKAWCTSHPSIPKVLDIRRLITFGVIKGFLYRVHKYAILSSPSSIATTKRGKTTSARSASRSLLSSSMSLSHDNGNAQDNKYNVIQYPKHQDQYLKHFLDGTHCFDEICTDLGISEETLIERLRDCKLGEVHVICR